MKAVARNLFLLTGIFFLPLSEFSQSQHINDEVYSFDFAGEPLSRVLEHIANDTGVDLIYDPQIVDGYYIYERLRNQTLQDILTTILRNSSLDYIILSSGTYVVVKSTLLKSSSGSFSGRVIDSQTGEPLPGATVMFADASGGTSTGSSGHFNINNILSGEYELIFSYIGYEPVRKQITVAPEHEIRESIQLQPKQVDFRPIVISAHHPMLPTGHSPTGSLETMSGWDTGNRSHDAIHSLSIFSGIQHGIPLTDLHLQGSQSGDHRIYLDDIPVYNPYSFGQLFSAFSPFALGKVTIDKAGFDVTAGSLTGGKINLYHDVAKKDGQNVLLQVDPVNINIRGDFNHQRSEDSVLYMMSAFRSTFWNKYQDPSLSAALNDWDLVDPLTYTILSGDTERNFESANHDSEIRYHDFHLASRYEFDPYHSISFTFYTGENEVNTDLLAANRESAENIYMYSRDNYEWENLATGIIYDWLASPRLDLRFQLSYSKNELNHRYIMFDNESIRNTATGLSESSIFDHLSNNIQLGAEQTDTNLIRHFISRTDLTYSFSPRFSLQSGLQYDRVESRFHLTDLFYLPTLNDSHTNIYSTYLNTNWVRGNNLKIQFGSRFTLISPSNSIYAEPRISIQYDQPESSFGYWSLKLSGGIYRQFINQFEITNVGPSSLVPNFTIWSHDSNIDQPKAYHSSASLIVEPGNDTSITLDGYFKYHPATYITSYRNLMAGIDLNRSGLESFSEVTKMHAYGFGARLQQTFLDSHIRLLLGYDYSISKIDMMSQFGRQLTAPWNEPHRLQARVLSKVSSNISLIAKWQSILGRKWAFRQAYYDFLVPHSFVSAGQFDFMNPERDKLKAFHQLDLSIIYRPIFGSVNMEFRANLNNILNRNNTIDWNLIPTESSTGEDIYEIRKRTLPGFNPSFSLNLFF
jgi:hypothetical protein